MGLYHILCSSLSLPGQRGEDMVTVGVGLHVLLYQSHITLSLHRCEEVRQTFSEGEFEQGDILEGEGREKTGYGIHTVETDQLYSYHTQHRSLIGSTGYCIRPIRAGEVAHTHYVGSEFGIGAAGKNEGSCCMPNYEWRTIKCRTSKEFTAYDHRNYTQNYSIAGACSTQRRGSSRLVSAVFTDLTLSQPTCQQAVFSCCQRNKLFPWILLLRLLSTGRFRAILALSLWHPDRSLSSTTWSDVCACVLQSRGEVNKHGSSASAAAPNLNPSSSPDSCLQADLCP